MTELLKLANIAIEKVKKNEDYVESLDTVFQYIVENYPDVDTNHPNYQDFLVEITSYTKNNITEDKLNPDNLFTYPIGIFKLIIMGCDGYDVEMNLGNPEIFSKFTNRYRTMIANSFSIKN